MLPHRSNLVAVASLMVALAHPALLHAAPLAYDGFSAGGSSPGTGQYVSTPASTTGVNNDSLFNQGPTLTGFSGLWTGLPGNYAASVYYRMNDAGLSYGSLETTFGEVELFRSSSSSPSAKPLTRATSYTGGSSLYFSMLLNYSFAHTTEVKLFPGANSLSIGTNAVGQAVLRYGGSVLGNSTSSLTLNSTHLIVARVNDDDTFSLWLNPTDLSTEGANVASATGSGAVYATGTTFTSMELNTTAPAVGNSTIFDEIRVGSTWSDVLPVPEPTSAVLIAFGLACLVARRRRQITTSC